MEKGDTNVFSRKKILFAERSLDVSRTFVSCEVIRGRYNISPQATHVCATKNSKERGRERVKIREGKEMAPESCGCLFCVATPKKGGLVGWMEERKQG